MAITAIPIQVVKTTAGQPPLQTRVIEEATQTFFQGVPVMQAADGGIKLWDGTSLTNAIVGISYEDAHNFATTGPDWTTGISGGYTGAGAQMSFGHVPNEPSALNIPRGAPFVDGRIGYTLALTEHIFRGSFGNNGSPATPGNSDVGAQYGLTIDSGSNYFYVDKNKTGASAAVVVVGLDPVVGGASGGPVLFAFLPGVIKTLTA